ncbi:MAG: hypothetical protein E3K37_02900 [Candidatus Kuenenia sp.]|nr:hypothetical protein [Candidatus Kuenenia hertensis]
MSHICIFEDIHYSRLSPLVYTRATFELRCGLYTPLERASKLYPGAIITLFCRDYLTDVLKERYNLEVNAPRKPENSCLFINGRAILSHPVPPEGPEEIGIQGDTVIYLRLKKNTAGKISFEKFPEENNIEKLKNLFPRVDIRVPVLHYFWDIIKHNASQITEDFSLFVREGRNAGKDYEGAYLINKDKIYIGKDSRVKPCCVIDAENGPVYIGNNVTISPNTTVEGPVYIGDNSVVQPNSRLRRGTNIGEVCKIGGENVNTIFHSYTNKQHDGFLGDSYIGSWVNIGADTTNSNLLNTYDSIKVQMGNELINTNNTFLGMAMGDHTKTAINTKIMTGSIFGFGCNIVTNLYPPKYLPSFSWCSDHGVIAYTLEKVLRVAKIAMGRREKEMSPSEEELFKKIFDLTKEERTICKKT